MLKAFRDTPNVIEVLRVTGSDSYVVHILARSSEELETVIDKIGSFGVVNTSLVLSTPLPASERVANTLGSTD
nr:Lrp/AsnC ligand binding domain-containing protein [Variovorax terrae]